MPHGCHGWAVQRLARCYGVSPATIYRWADLGGTPRPRKGRSRSK